MARSAITTAEITAGEPVTNSLWTKVKGNDDDHETRINSLEGGTSKVIVFDEIVDLEGNREGDIRMSFLSSSDIQDKHGADWVAIDGSSVSGTDLASTWGTSTLPDATDARYFKAGENSNAQGALENSSLPAHIHKVYEYTTNTDSAVYGSNGAAKVLSTTTHGGGGDSALVASNVGSTVVVGEDLYTENSQSQTVSNAEIKPRTLTVQAAIKKNDKNLDYVSVFRAPADLSISSFRVSNLEAGTAGTLTVDILKGSALGTVSTMLSSDLTLTAASGNYATSSEATFSSNSISSGEFVVLKVKGLQTAQVRFHVSCYADL